MSPHDSKTALIIVDMQVDFVMPMGAKPCSGALDAVPYIRQVLDFFRENHWPVFHVVRRHEADGSDVERFRKELFMKKPYAVAGTPGWEIIPEFTPKEDEYIIDKTRFSAFMGTGLDVTLKELNVTGLVVTGIQYPTCVRATIFDALALDYMVTLITDATAAHTPEVAAANIRDFQNLGIPCLTAHQFLQGE